jgi:glycosyltransferase involved in cell wall biosynthesis
MRVGIVQRVLASYRRPLFERLAKTSGISLSVIAGNPLPDEGLGATNILESADLWNTRNRYWRIPSGYIYWQVGLVQWLSSFNPDVLVLGADPRSASAWVAIRWMKKRKRAVLGWGLGELPRNSSAIINRGREIIAAKFVRAMDGMIAYSTKAAEDYLRMGIPVSKVFVAHNSIDNRESEHFLSKLTPSLDWVEQWKRALGILGSLPIVLFVGRLLPQKRVDLLISACAPLFDRCNLVIVGDGPSMEDLKKLARPYEKSIIFIGHQSGKTLAECFIASEFFVLPGLGGLALHQAMSYGKAVIASFGDGTEVDLVRQGMNGYFFKDNDCDDLRGKIERMLMDKELTHSMGAASLSIIRNEINIDAMVASFKHALDVMQR